MRIKLAAALCGLGLLLLTACGAATDPAPAGSGAGEAVQETGDAPNGDGWPREITDARGRKVIINSQPQRIVTLSLGLDEVTMALVGPGKFAAISDVARSEFGNIPELAAQVEAVVTSDVESVLAVAPDIVLVDGFSDPNLVGQVEAAGLPVIVVDLYNTFEEQIESVRLLAYIYGVEERGEELAAAIEGRLARLEELVGEKLADHGPLPVMQLASGLFTPGSDTNSDAIIQAAGGINVVAQAGLQSWQQITLEKIIDLAPEVIIYDDYDAGQTEFTEGVLGNPALADVPAIRNQRFCLVPHRYMSTLSFWNVRGAEELARCLWDLDEEFEDFH